MIHVESMALVANSGDAASPPFAVQNGPMFSLEFPVVTSCQATLQASYKRLADVASADFGDVYGRDGTAVTLDIGAGSNTIHFGDVAIAARTFRLKYGVAQGSGQDLLAMQRQAFAI